MNAPGGRRVCGALAVLYLGCGTTLAWVAQSATGTVHLSRIMEVSTNTLLTWLAAAWLLGGARLGIESVVATR